MSLDQLFSNFSVLTVGFAETIIRLFGAFVFGSIVAYYYKLFHSSDDSPNEMMSALLLISMIISTAMIIIGNNLASAFGLIGAVSIVRFRTSIKSIFDMTFLFLAIILSMASGLGYYLQGAIGLVAFGVVLLVIYLWNQRTRRETSSYLTVKVTSRGSRNLSELETLLFQECGCRYSLKSLKNDGDQIVSIYSCLFKKDINYKHFMEFIYTVGDNRISKIQVSDIERFKS